MISDLILPPSTGSILNKICLQTMRSKTSELESVERVRPISSKDATRHLKAMSPQLPIKPHGAQTVAEKHCTQMRHFDRRFRN